MSNVICYLVFTSAQEIQYIIDVSVATYISKDTLKMYMASNNPCEHLIVSIVLVQGIQ